MANGMLTQNLPPVPEETQIADNPLAALSRSFDTTVESLTNRGRRFYSNIEKLKEGEIGVGSMVLRTAGDLVGGSFSDMIGLPVGAAIDFAVPTAIAEPMQQTVAQGIQKLAETETGQDIQQYLDENPEVALNLQAAASLGEAIIPLKAKAGINRAALNTDTEIPNFYSGNPLAKIKGVLEKGVVGVGRAAQVAVSPKYRALEREYGVSKGLVAQTDQFLKAVEERPPLDAKIKAARDKAKAEGKAAPKVKDILTSDEFKAYELASKGPSYQQGALAYAYLLNKQMGKETDFLNTAFGKEHVLKATTMDRENFMSILPDVDDSIKNSFYTHATKVWGYDPNKLADTHVILKNPTSQTNMQAELFSPKGASSTGRFLYGLDLSPSDLTNPQVVLEKFKTRKLKADERALWLRGQDPAKAKRFTPEQQQEYQKINKKVNNTKAPNWNEATQTWTFTDSKLSAAKELGGMNHFFALKTNGDLTVIASDRHDMFGLDPLGGDALLTVFPPFKVNLFNRKFPDYSPSSKGKEESMRALAENYNTPIPAKSGRGFTQSTRQQAEAVLNLKPNVTMQDRLGAAGTVGMAASVPAAGMLTSQVEQQPQ